MSAETLDDALVAERVRVEVERLAATRSDHARRNLSRWWVKRLDQVLAFPGSEQLAVAAGVVDTFTPAAVAAYRRALAQPAEAGSEDTA